MSDYEVNIKILLSSLQLAGVIKGDKKRNALQYTKKNGVRYGASKIIPGWMADFTIGDETLDFDDPDWYKGTYWGDCVAFRKAFVLKT